jgi:predicted ATPase/transcriptional regulator with XRE-family HTH domain
MNGGALSEGVKAYLRRSGYSQKELADELGLNARVLSRKLTGSGNAHITHLEIQRLISILAGWRAITTLDEALDLLAAAQVDPAIFGDDAWETPPLSVLVRERAGSKPSNGSSYAASISHPDNLPMPTTRLIGREWAVERLRQLLGRDDVRLVTLVGSGGAGKTRLAMQVARELAGTFAQGAWFVALARQRDPALVPMSIMQALHIQSTPGVRPLQSLIASLKHRQLLLVLDNFEQVGEAASVVDEMLAAVPGLKALVTSRAVLRLSGEHKFSVPPLDVPDPFNTLEASELAQYGAVQLFLERARAMEPDFAMTAENAALIAQICARVDGLPLALELAAARVRVLPLAALLERLSKARLPVLTRGARNLPDRQQTLRDTITWSYDLLSKDEQAWFRRLGIFSGGWSLEAAEAMMQGDAGGSNNTPVAGSPLDMLEQLVDNSLLLRVPGGQGQARFTMLETLREYALDRLAEQGECEQLRDWHACYYLGEAEAAERGLRGPQQLAWLARVGVDRDNFRAALEWTLQRARKGTRVRASCSFPSEPMGIAVAGSRTFCATGVPRDGLLAIEVCLRLGAALRPYWEWQGDLTEARYWLKAALDAPLEERAGETALAARAKALSEASRLMCLQNDQGRAIELAEESIALWRRLDDPGGLATALLHRGWAAHAQGEYETAKRACEEGMLYASSEEDTWLRGQLLFYQGAAAGFSYDFARMRELYTQSRKLFEQVGDTSAVADVLKDQGGMSLLEGNCGEAIECLLKSLKLCYGLGHKQYMTTGMCLLSLAVGMRQQPDAAAASIRSAKLQGVADGLMEAIGFTPWTNDNAYVQMVRQHIRSQVDEHCYEAAWTEGKRLTLEQAIDLAYRLGEDVRS